MSARISRPWLKTHPFAPQIGGMGGIHPHFHKKRKTAMRSNEILKPPFLDKYIQAAIHHGGNKYDRYTGEHGTFIIRTDSSNETQALEIRNALYRAARRQKKELTTKVYANDEGCWVVEFTLIEPSYVKAPDFLKAQRRWHH